MQSGEERPVIYQASTLTALWESVSQRKEPLLLLVGGDDKGGGGGGMEGEEAAGHNEKCRQGEGWRGRRATQTSGFIVSFAVCRGSVLL